MKHKPLVSIVLSSLFILSSVVVTSAAPNTQKEEINFINQSNYNFITNERSSFKATISDVTQKDKPSVLIVDKGKGVTSDKENYDLIVELDTSDQEKSKISWFGKNNNNIILSGESTVRVDIQGYDEEKRATINPDKVRQETLLEAMYDGLQYVRNSKQTTENDVPQGKQTLVQPLSDVGDQDWKLIAQAQSSEHYVPYGITRLNYTFKKAHISNGSTDHFSTIGSQVQVNPGAQLCGSNPNYECKYQAEKISIRNRPSTSTTDYSMIDHKPVNQGSSGSSSYQIGGGYQSGSSPSFQLSLAYQFTVNWTSLTLTDNSNSYGDWTYNIANPLQSQVITVDAGATYISPDTKDWLYGHTSTTVTFDSWNTSPVIGYAEKNQDISWNPF